VLFLMRRPTRSKHRIDHRYTATCSVPGQWRSPPYIWMNYIPHRTSDIPTATVYNWFGFYSKSSCLFGLVERVSLTVDLPWRWGSLEGCCFYSYPRFRISSAAFISQVVVSTHDGGREAAVGVSLGLGITSFFTSLSIVCISFFPCVYIPVYLWYGNVYLRRPLISVWHLSYHLHSQLLCDALQGLDESIQGLPLGVDTHD
jgi:hypothetical protein